MYVVLEELLKLEDAAIGLDHRFADHNGLLHYSLTDDFLSGQCLLASILAIDLLEF